MDNYKVQISENMIQMLDKAVKNDDVKLAKQIITKYFNDPKLVARFLTALFDGKRTNITIKEMVHAMLDGTVKALFEEKEAEAKKGDKEAYQAFFKKALEKFDVKSPDELSGDKEKEFYDYVDKNWKGDEEEPEPEDKKMDEGTLSNSSAKGPLQDIAKMTDSNNHIGAYIAGAKYLKNKKLENVFMGIQMIQQAEGSLTREVDVVRMKYYKDMIAYAKQKLKPDEFKMFYDAF